MVLSIIPLVHETWESMMFQLWSSFGQRVPQLVILASISAALSGWPMFKESFTNIQVGFRSEQFTSSKFSHEPFVDLWKYMQLYDLEVAQYLELEPPRYSVVGSAASSVVVSDGNWASIDAVVVVVVDLVVLLLLGVLKSEFISSLVALPDVLKSEIHGCLISGGVLAGFPVSVGRLKLWLVLVHTPIGQVTGRMLGWVVGGMMDGAKWCLVRSIASSRA
jgi:hypothetical protein